MFSSEEDPSLLGGPLPYGSEEHRFSGLTIAGAAGYALAVYLQRELRHTPLNVAGVRQALQLYWREMGRHETAENLNELQDGPQ